MNRGVWLLTHHAHPSIVSVSLVRFGVGAAVGDVLLLPITLLLLLLLLLFWSRVD